MQLIHVKTVYYFTLLTLPTSLLLAHGGKKHETKKPTNNPTEVSIQKDMKVVETMTQQTLDKDTIQSVSKMPTPTKEEIKNTLYQEINTVYLSDIKPIFEKKCFDCHGTLQKKPWYYDVPLVSYMIQKDIEEAKEHMDMTQDFPFISHDTPYNDLKSIRDIGNKGSMPPLKYIIGHWDSRLTDGEKKVLIQWSQSAMKKLEKNKLNVTSEVSH